MVGNELAALLDDLIETFRKALPVKGKESKMNEINEKKEKILNLFNSTQKESSSNIRTIVKEVIEVMKVDKPMEKSYASVARQQSAVNKNDQPRSVFIQGMNILNISPCIR